jgi:beta-lactamase regulating signal transducer with metallopeptidase domain
LVVLAHERAHISHRDFYVQIIASLYAALVWFSPLGWWLKRKLSDLGETISDHAGLEEARNRSAYARILLEFAATPHPNFIGVAMARKSNISRRIEQLLNDRVFSQGFGAVRSLRLYRAHPSSGRD